MNSQVGASAEVSFTEYEELRSETEQRLWEDGTRTTSMEVSAPFVDRNGQSRLMIDGCRDLAYSWPSILHMHKAQNGVELGVEVIDGSMGRPLLTPESGAAKSHFGDVKGVDYFDAFILRLENYGGVSLDGRLFGKSEFKMLDSVNPEELVAFGRAILFAVNIHKAKIYEESRVLTTS